MLCVATFVSSLLKPAPRWLKRPILSVLREGSQSAAGASDGLSPAMPMWSFQSDGVHTECCMSNRSGKWLGQNLGPIGFILQTLVLSHQITVWEPLHTWSVTLFLESIVYGGTCPPSGSKSVFAAQCQKAAWAYASESMVSKSWNDLSALHNGLFAIVLCIC